MLLSRLALIPSILAELTVRLCCSLRGEGGEEQKGLLMLCMVRTMSSHDYVIELEYERGIVQEVGL